MILTCPQCETRYLVNAQTIGEEGRVVRCAKCGHSWHADPEIAQAPTPPPALEPQFSSLAAWEPSDDDAAPPSPVGGLPALRPRTGAPWQLKLAACLMAVLWLVTAPFAYRDALTATMPALQGFYDALGGYSSAGVAFSAASHTEVEGTKRLRFAVEGSITNTSGNANRMPVLRVTFRNGEGKAIGEWNFAQEDKTLSPGQVLPFRADRLESFKGKPATIELDIGSPLELAVRP